MIQVCDVARYFLVYLILVVICWSYYAYVIELCIIWSKSTVQKVFYILVYHLLVLVFIYSYIKAVISKPPPIPLEFYLDSQEHAISLDINSDRDKWRKFLEELIVKKNLTVYTRDIGSNIRFCSICQLIKPDRAHHCSSCGRCLLRMDHHCPWVGNCVGFHNHKFFILLLGYGSLFCLFVAATSIEFAISWWQDPQPKNMRGVNFLILVVVSAMFFFVQISLYLYHIYLTINNQTTLESMRRSIFQDPEVDSFNLGAIENLKELMGDSVCSWFVPIQSSRGNGIVYPVKRKRMSYQSLEDHINIRNS